MERLGMLLFLVVEDVFAATISKFLKFHEHKLFAFRFTKFVLCDLPSFLQIEICGTLQHWSGRQFYSELASRRSSSLRSCDVDELGSLKPP
jgi:hypothetical protein